jgi:hypothetical protein
MSGTVGGIVYAGDGETPIGNAFLSMKDQASGLDLNYSYTTESDGAFNFNNQALPLNGFRIVAGYASSTGETNGSLNSPGDTVVLNITVPISVIKGTVSYSDSATQVPSPSVSVTQIDDFGGRQFYFPNFVDAQGNFSVLGIEVGEFEITAQEPLTGISISTFSTLMDVQTAVTLDLVLPPSGTVTGTVYDSSGNPMPFADIGINSVEDGSEKFDVADDEGHFNIEIVRGGGVNVQACVFTGSAICGTSSGAIVSEGETITVNVTLPESASIQGTVYQPDGVTPAAGALVKVFNLEHCGPMGCGTAEGTTDASGNFALSGIASGEVFVTAEDEALKRGNSFSEIDSATGTNTAIVRLGNVVDFICVEGVCEPYALTGSDGFVYGVGRDAELDARLEGDFPDPYNGAFRLKLRSFEFNENNIVIETPASEIFTSPDALNSLVVKREVFVPPSGGFARYLEVLRNPHDVPIPVSVIVDGFHNSSQLHISPDTTGYTYALATGDCCIPALGFVFGGTSAPVQLQAARFKNERPYFSYRWNVTVPPNDTVILMHFAVQRNSGETAPLELQAQSLVNLTDPDALTGMSTEERSKVVNFDVP